MARIPGGWSLTQKLLALVLAGCMATIELPGEFGLATPAFGQFPVIRRVELSDAISLDEADSTARSKLAQVQAYVSDGQWSEAVETLRRVQEGHGEKLLPGPEAIGSSLVRRYVSVREHCQFQFSALPPEALELYRRRIDPLAEIWYERGVAQRDVAQLTQLVEEAFCSRRGDDALLLLGDLAFERGDYVAAEDSWTRILPLPAPHVIRQTAFEEILSNDGLGVGVRNLLTKWYLLEESISPPSYVLRRDESPPPAEAQLLARFWKARGLAPRLTYPDTDLDIAGVEARLILAAIFAGRRDEAAQRIEQFGVRHGDAAGHLAGRQVEYRAMLTALLAASENWAETPPPAEWPTFAGNGSRNGDAPAQWDLGAPAWRAPLQKTTLPDPGLAASYNFRPRRVAEETTSLLSCHPVVADGRVFFNNELQIFALDLATGKPAWPSASGRPAGEIYYVEPPPHGNRFFSLLGVPRFTLTVRKNKLLARMGSPVTSPPAQNLSGRRNESFLICLDLAAQGRLIWEYRPVGDEWAIEGTPIADDRAAYAAVRQGGVRSRTYVAAFDLEDGRLLWRQFVCGADTPTRGDHAEATHNLLTLHEGTLYYNTNLGAVAALSAQSGHIRWVAAYPRAKPKETLDLNRKPAYLYRDLNPCVYHEGVVYAAPADFNGVLALDADSGRLLWETQHPEDAVHLLGVAGGNLIATGDKVWWFDARFGQAKAPPWPVDPSPRGFGRGTLAGGAIGFPTRDQLYLLDPGNGRPVRQPIDLKVFLRPDGGGGLGNRGVEGGNLVVGEGYLLIAGAEELAAFRLTPPADEPVPQAAEP